YTPERVKPYLTSEQYKLYKLIYARALASLMAAAKYDSLSVTLSQNGYDFTTQGSTLKFDGYLKAYAEYDNSKDVILPVLEEGEKISAKELKPNQHFTEPPSRYTEARLIKALEEDGIGRPSTYAMIIDTIQARGYVSLEKSSPKSRTRVFVPTEQGMLTTEKLDEFFSDIINVDYTSFMEGKLDDIAEGTAQEVRTLRDFYDRFQPLLEKAYEGMEKIQPEKVGEVCPDCGGELVYRTGRFGKFISCANFPKCHYTRQIEDETKEKPEPTGKMCPDCGHELLKRKSRYGTYFLGCSNFPDCTYMESLDGQKIVAKAKTTKKKTTATRRRRKAS
ncbi:MAG: topoisomerase DNA-binding C4 zinc finger domain-containing protein, partial [Solobacterium sp.]|nr:topoisomerase DNA-binding C4 zinc finger domain-containing protein [Solobacterium sp.]